MSAGSKLGAMYRKFLVASLFLSLAAIVAWGGAS
jgi:hypothetical protein